MRHLFVIMAIGIAVAWTAGCGAKAVSQGRDVTYSDKVECSRLMTEIAAKLSDWKDIDGTGTGTESGHRGPALVSGTGTADISDRLRRVAKERSLIGERNAALARSFFEAGLASLKALRHEDALMYFRRAVELDPRNIEARKELDELEGMLGSRPGEVRGRFEKFVSEYAAGDDQRRLKIDVVFARGQKAYEECEYEKAAADFKLVLNLLKAWDR